MGFEPGHKKVGGRQAGTTNKASAEIREAINNFLQGNISSIQKKWDELEAKDQLNFWRDLLRYAVPQLQSIEVQSDFEKLTDEQLTELYENLKAEMLRNLNRDER